MIIDQYAAGANHLILAVSRLAEKELDYEIDDQNWTIRQIVHHVVDGDMLWHTCIKAALGSKKPFHLKWYWEISQITWANVWLYDRRDINPSLKAFQANRDSLCQLLRLVPNVLEKEVVIIWPNDTERQSNIMEILKMQIDHVAEHVGDIQKIIRLHQK